MIWMWIRGLMRQLGNHVVRNPLLLFFAFFLIFPLIAPYYGLATQVLIFGLFAMAFNIVYTHSGLFSLGHAAYFGLGAYGAGLILPTTSILSKANPGYGIGSAIAQFKVELAVARPRLRRPLRGDRALVIGALCLRRRGIYFSNAYTGVRPTTLLHCNTSFSDNRRP